MGAMTMIGLESNEAMYFAYGTLLDLDEIHKYCPSAKSMGVFRLKGSRLAFKTCGPDQSKGGCTLVNAPDNIMYGILYKMSDADRKNLDKISGLDQGFWAIHKITLLDKDNDEAAAETYVIPNPGGHHMPPESYTRPILSGARQIPLPNDYIAQLESIIKGDFQ
jgi:AIG2-like family